MYSPKRIKKTTEEFIELQNKNKLKSMLTIAISTALVETLDATEELSEVSDGPNFVNNFILRVGAVLRALKENE